MDYSDETALQGQAIIYGIAYSISHPLLALLTIMPIPFNAFLVFCDVSLWLTQLILWQTWYFLELCIWWMDLWYQISVFMILDYPSAAAMFRWRWFDIAWLMAFFPVYLGIYLSAVIWSDDFSSRPNWVEFNDEWLWYCNPYYYDEDSSYY